MHWSITLGQPDQGETNEKILMHSTSQLCCELMRHIPGSSVIRFYYIPGEVGIHPINTFSSQCVTCGLGYVISRLLRTKAHRKSYNKVLP